MIKCQSIFLFFILNNSISIWYFIFNVFTMSLSRPTESNNEWSQFTTPRTNNSDSLYLRKCDTENKKTWKTRESLREKNDPDQNYLFMVCTRSIRSHCDFIYHHVLRKNISVLERSIIYIMNERWFIPIAAKWSFDKQTTRKTKSNGITVCTMRWEDEETCYLWLDDRRADPQFPTVSSFIRPNHKS